MMGLARMERAKPIVGHTLSFTSSRFVFYSNRVPAALAQKVAITLSFTSKTSTKYDALSAATDLLEQFVIAKVHQQRSGATGVNDPGYSFIHDWAETRFQQTGAAGVLRRIGWNGCSAFATKSFGGGDSHRATIPFIPNTARKFPKGYERNAAMRWRSSSSISAGVATVWATSSRNTCR
jgi:hypothetical protein